MTGPAKLVPSGMRENPLGTSFAGQVILEKKAADQSHLWAVKDWAQLKLDLGVYSLNPWFAPKSMSDMAMLRQQRIVAFL